MRLNPSYADHRVGVDEALAPDCRQLQSPVDRYGSARYQLIAGAIARRLPRWSMYASARSAGRPDRTSVRRNSGREGRPPTGLGSAAAGRRTCTRISAAGRSSPTGAPTRHASPRVPAARWRLPVRRVRRLPHRSLDVVLRPQAILAAQPDHEDPGTRARDGGKIASDERRSRRHPDLLRPQPECGDVVNVDHRG